MAEAVSVKPIPKDQEQVKVDAGKNRSASDTQLPDKVHTWPYLVRAEFIAGCVMILLLLIWSITIDAPLEEPSNPSKTPNPSKAPWYFLGLQEMLVYFDPWIAGVILMFYYRPTQEYAYLDIKYLDFDVPFGMLMRNMHRWAAHGMVIYIWVHMLRVFMTGSYKPPREFNWVVGVNLLVLTMLMSFTGYLLPWDQLAIWAVTVGTNMARATPLLGHEGPFANLVGVNSRYDARSLLVAGRLVGSATLLRFYVLHCIFIPVVASVLMIVHFWRIRKDGGISGPL